MTATDVRRIKEMRRKSGLPLAECKRRVLAEKETQE